MSPLDKAVRCNSGRRQKLNSFSHKQRLGAIRAFVVVRIMATKTNPRHQNGNLRRKYRARLKAMQCPCGICGGRLGAIHYDEPSDAQHPLSFVIDEIRPVSLWKQFGYDSPAAAAQDWNNLQAAHYICNAKKSNKVGGQVYGAVKTINIIDGDW